MDVAMVGLGRMGGNMARRLLRDGHRAVVEDAGEGRWTAEQEKE